MISFPNPRSRGGRSVVSLLTLGGLLAVAAASTPPTARAQQMPGMAAPAAAPNPLNLTADQKNKMKAIQLKYKPAADKLREQMRTLAMKADKDMMLILTPAQKAKLKQLQAAQMQQMQGGAGGNVGRNRP